MITSLVIAMNFVKQIKLHVKTINQCVLMIESIEIYLRYNNLSINEIFELLAENESYNHLTFIKRINDNIISGKSSYILSEENIKIIKNNSFLNSNDKDNVISFLSVLGKSDLNGQIANCKTYKEIFKKTLNCLEAKEQFECKSTSTLILGVGILFIILII